MIQADSGSGQGVFEAGSAALNNANVFISKLNALLDQNQKAINTTMTNVQQFTTMLAEKKDDIGQAISDVKDGAQVLQVIVEQARSLARG